MSVHELTRKNTHTPRGGGVALGRALRRIAERAAQLDREPRFPAENFADLAETGVLRPAARGGGDGAAGNGFSGAVSDGFVGEVRLVRAVAGADASTARILDGHLNGLERLALCAAEPMRSRELARIGECGLLLGVWGADPGPGEGPPVRLQSVDGGLVLRGVKTFCSGAGGVHRALVVASDEQDRRRLAYVDTASSVDTTHSGDTTSSVAVDRDWYRVSGLRSSESHRVEFHDAPVLELLGGPGELTREPWFSRDAVRTSATWAGLADAIVRATIDAVDSARMGEVSAHAVGLMFLARATIDRWLEHTTSALDHSTSALVHTTAALGDAAGKLNGFPGDERKPARLAAECRIALAENARTVSSQAARVGGSRALVGGGTLDRARRDLDLFLLQHRLDPKIVALGVDALKGAGR